MRKLIPLLFSLSLLTACSTSNQQSGQQFGNSESTALATSSKSNLPQVSHALDGLSFDGSVRARGIIGLFSVNGNLSFADGQLIWTVKDSKDTGPYHTTEVEGGLNFNAKLSIENNEQVEWSGFYDGKTLHNVYAVWTRNKGDFVHDLFLPKQVTLDFTLK
jgi:hypothetical protein